MGRRLQLTDADGGPGRFREPSGTSTRHGSRSARGTYTLLPIEGHIMGMDQTVTFGGGRVPAWEAVRDLLAGLGFPVQMRMIDGQLAFPDEAPPEDWRELRLGTAQGMVTVRRDGDVLSFVTWGNADGAMRQAWNAFTWAFAQAGAGQVQTPGGQQSPDDYRRAADLPEALRLGTPR